MITQIQALPGWALHTPNDGSQIGGIQPTNCGTFCGAPLGPTQRALYVEGPAYATVEAYYLAPLPTASQFSLSFDLTVSSPSLAALMLIETDLIHCDGTSKRNMSLQRRLDRAGAIQISGQDGGWVDAGILGIPITPDAATPHQISYGIGASNFGIQAVRTDPALVCTHQPQSAATQAHPLELGQGCADSASNHARRNPRQSLHSDRQYATGIKPAAEMLRRITNEKARYRFDVPAGNPWPQLRKGQCRCNYWLHSLGTGNVSLARWPRPVLHFNRLGVHLV
jgi:hypothetical protein